MSIFTIIDALDDPAVFGKHFKRSNTWEAWKAFLASMFALPLTPEQLELYKKHTGRTNPPSEPLHEAWLSTSTAASRTLKSSTRSSRGWRPSRMRCCCAPAHHTHARAL
jgi:hypothetical protein